MLRRRRRGPLVPTLVVLAGLLVLALVGTRTLTDVWWFSQLDYLQTFTTRLRLQVILFVVGALLMAAAIAVSLTVGYRSRPIYAPISTEQAGLDRYRESLEPLRRLVVIALSVAAGLFGGSVAMGQWETVLLWWNREPFGRNDAQFGIDLGFYVFTLPFLTFLVGLLSAAVVLSGIAGLATHYLYGGLRLAGAGPRTTRAARIHLATLAAMFLLLRGAGYWLDRYQLMTAQTSRIDIEGVVGPSYTDVHAVLPAKAILAVVAVFVAALFIAAAVGSSWRLPAIGTGLLVFSAIAVGGIYPWAVQYFVVRPDAQARESEFIQKNIAATREAYDLADTDVRQYDAQTTVEPGQLRQDAGTIPGIRLLDPTVVSNAYRQTQQVRPYYSFPDTLDVDRYQLPGSDGQTVEQDTVIAAREIDLSGLNNSQRNWINEHLVYTHGFGLIAARGNERAADGLPSFFQQGLPTSGALGEYEQRIYFGEKSPTYSIVGGDDPIELDYPDNSPLGYAQTRYAGEGGVPVGGLGQKLAYALKFADQNILLSDQIGENSKIMYDRAPRDRVEKVAPWLTLDGDSYPAVVDGRIKWIVDAYTTSDGYPYSAITELGEATTDTLTEGSQSVQALQDRSVNYVRNSVKATVDAYDGSVTLYAWDDSDPVLRSWMKSFPGAVRPLSEISGDLMEHLRYPQDMFKVQRDVLGSYHVTDPNAFFTQQGFWRTPEDPTATVGQNQSRPAQPPYYLTLQMPGQTSTAFSLTTSYVPRSQAQGAGSGSRVLTGFAAVDADAGGESGVKKEGYGTIRLLQLPGETTVQGPEQVQANIVSDTDVGNELRLLNQGESQVVYGNLLTLPVGDGLLYVEPVYVQSRTGASYPVLRKVVAVFGNQIGFADTLDEALDQVFEGDSGAQAGDQGAPPTGTDPDTGQPPTDGGTDGNTGGNTGGGTDTTAQQDLRTALDSARTAITDSATALENGDFAAYGEAQQRLQAAVNAAVDAENRIEQAAAATPTATPEATPSASPTTPGATG